MYVTIEVVQSPNFDGPILLSIWQQAPFQNRGLVVSFSLSQTLSQHVLHRLIKHFG